MWIVLSKLSSILASLAVILTFQQAQIVQSIPTPTPAQVVQSAPVVNTSTTTPTPTPDISVLVQQVQDLQNTIAAMTPEPTPQVIYVTPTPIPTPTPTPFISKAEIKVEPDSSTIASTDSVIFRIEVYDQDGRYTNLPVDVSTDYPGLPSTFTVNGPGSISWFSICNMKDLNHNECKEGNDRAVYPGTFTFHFSQSDLSISKDITMTIK